MKNKRIIFIGCLGLIIALCGIYFYSRNPETTIYIGMANPSENMDILVKIDDNTIFDNTISYRFQYNIRKVPLKTGFHKVYVHSNSKGLTTEKEIFLLFKQHLVIEYYPQTNDNNKKNGSFYIRNRLNPFYLE